MANLKKYVETVEGIERLLQIPKEKGEVIWNKDHRQQMIGYLTDSVHVSIFKETLSVYLERYPRNTREIRLMENHYLWFFAETFLKKLKVSGCQIGK